jgi:hypothetical protein
MVAGRAHSSRLRRAGGAVRTGDADCRFRWKVTQPLVDCAGRAGGETPGELLAAIP